MYHETLSYVCFKTSNMKIVMCQLLTIFCKLNVIVIHPLISCSHFRLPNHLCMCGYFRYCLSDFDDEMTKSICMTWGFLLFHWFFTVSISAKAIGIFIFSSIVLHLTVCFIYYSPFSETKKYLSQDPFKQFLESKHFKRYLQWKWLEL